MSSFFDTRIEFLKGVGPKRAELLNKELGVFTYADLIQQYPFRHEDRTRFYSIAEVSEELPFVQLRGTIRHIESTGSGRGKRLVAWLNDGTGEIELVWFKGIQWMVKKLKPGVEYVVFGKASRYGRKLNIAHPEIDFSTAGTDMGGHLQPVYSSTEKLRNGYLDSKGIAKLQKTLLQLAKDSIRETLPLALIDSLRLMPKAQALQQIHFPDQTDLLHKARFRLKFEELFYIQLRLLMMKLTRREQYPGIVFNNAQLVSRFYNEYLPFELTGAQKRVIKECYADMRCGKQMNRLLQGDVGSGKTIVSFICMLLAISGGSQAALMAPTEILADQHYKGLKGFAEQLGLNIALLTGSSKAAQRRVIHQMLIDGELHILVGTHALLEEKVQFKELGLAVIDEQHRFGVAQRARLWKKNQKTPPHILVMTATPIPRTLAMTLYGDLDVSVIDELPAGRKPIQTSHRFEKHRLRVFGFIKEQVSLGRQTYIVYPLIQESENADYKNLMEGYEAVQRAFPNYQISIVHGKMKAADKDFEMQRFVKQETQIMVATTVIEVGVNVPNATVMVIENAERFGLAQLHQLRGRVGRGADQSYCILMSDFKISKESRARLDTMVRTNDGFEIAETDLRLRGPGDLEGTQQSGITDLLISDLAKDGEILKMARQAAQDIMTADPTLSQPENQLVKQQVAAQKKGAINWSRIS